MGRDLMVPRTDLTTHIPSGVASPIATNHAAKGSVFAIFRNAGNLKYWSARTCHETENLLPGETVCVCVCVCVCVRERESERVRVCVRESESERDRESVCVRERK